MTRCPRCAEENPPRARFCLACGLSLERADVSVGAGERRLVTAVFVDLVGSTARAEQLDPEDVSSRLVPYYSRLRDELERFGGTVEKFIGDAVVALFGAPIGNEDDPERALRAAFAVRAAIADLNATDAWLALEVRIGVATGEALVRTEQSPTGQALAMGDMMNTAARIQAAAAPGTILVGARTHRATRHAVEYATVEPVSARGKAEPIEVWQAVGLKQSPARRHSDAPFVGRHRRARRARRAVAASPRRRPAGHRIRPRGSRDGEDSAACDLRRANRGTRVLGPVPRLRGGRGVRARRRAAVRGGGRGNDRRCAAGDRRPAHDHRRRRRRERNRAGLCGRGDHAGRGALGDQARVRARRRRAAGRPRLRRPALGRPCAHRADRLSRAGRGAAAHPRIGAAGSRRARRRLSSSAASGGSSSRFRR